MWDPILVTLLKTPEITTPFIVNPVVKMQPHPAAYSHWPTTRKCAPPPVTDVVSPSSVFWQSFSWFFCSVTQPKHCLIRSPSTPVDWIQTNLKRYVQQLCSKLRVKLVWRKVMKIKKTWRKMQRKVGLLKFGAPVTISWSVVYINSVIIIIMLRRLELNVVQYPRVRFRNRYSPKGVWLGSFHHVVSKPSFIQTRKHIFIFTYDGFVTLCTNNSTKHWKEAKWQGLNL